MAVHVVGGSASTPTGLIGAISDPANTEFILGDGFYTGGDINTTVLGARPGLMIRAEHRWEAKLGPLGLSAPNITLDGVDITYDQTSVITISHPGAQVLNCRIHDFNRTVYGNGIWVLRTALDPPNPILLEGNTITDWGGGGSPADLGNVGAGILVGSSGDAIDLSEVTIEIIDNTITNGPTTSGIHSAGIGFFHPCIVTGNRIDSVSGAGISSKARNSTISSNELSNVVDDGALYNRFQGNNLWQYNLVHDCTVGIDHFMGEDDIFRGNVIYNCREFGRIKNQGDTSILIENNTFYNGIAGWTWDTSDPSGHAMHDILWRKNIWDTGGVAIMFDLEVDGLWDETENIFWHTTPPINTTGAVTGTSLTINPRLADPPVDFTPTEPRARGKGAPWPLPGFPRPSRVLARDDYGIRDAMTFYKQRVMLGWPA